MSKIKQWKLKTKIFACLGVVLLGIVSLWGYNYYMEQQKVNNLYKHGFRLLEEQIATYIVENYSGVSKVEFSPILVDGDGRFTVRTVNVVPVVYDEQGNKAELGGRVGNTKNVYAKFGLLNGISALDFDVYGNEVIYLERSSNGDEIDVSNYEHLPEHAKLLSDEFIDSIISDLIKSNYLIGVSKNSEGSPNADIIYNTTIEEEK